MITIEELDETIRRLTGEPFKNRLLWVKIPPLPVFLIMR